MPFVLPPRFVQLALLNRGERAPLVVNVGHFIGRALDLALDVVLTTTVLDMRIDGVAGVGWIEYSLHDHIFINTLAQRRVDEGIEQVAARGPMPDWIAGTVVRQIKHG